MDVLKSDENKTLDDEEIDEMTPLKTELKDEGEETIELFQILKSMRMFVTDAQELGRTSHYDQMVLYFY